MFLLRLRRDRRSMRLMRIGFLFGRWTRGYSTAATVEGNVRRVIHNNGAVHVNIGDRRGVHVHHSGVVEEISAAPFAATEAGAAISKAVVNTAIEANLRSPVTAVPGVGAVVPAPVAGSPEQTGLRRLDPGAGHPVITVVVIPGPVAGSPQIARAGANGLIVNRQRGRSDLHGDSDPDLRHRWGRKGCWKSQQQKSKRQHVHCAVKFHSVSSCPLDLPKTAAPGSGNSSLSVSAAGWSTLLGKKLFGMSTFVSCF